MKLRFLPLLGLLFGGILVPVHASDPPFVVPLLPAEVCPVPPEPPTPKVSLKVRVPACAAPGQEITYRICVENCSAAPAHHVLVKDEVPKGAKFVRASPEPHAKQPELQWKLGTLEPGACKEIVLVLLPEGKDDLKNCARVQFEHGQCVTTRVAAAAPAVTPEGIPVPPIEVKPPATGEPPLGEKEKKPLPMPPPPPAAGDPKLELTVTAPKKQYANLPVKYQITLNNAGTGKAGALVAATLPENTKFVSASNGGVFLDKKVAWYVGDLPAGGKKTVTLVYEARAAGEFCVTAEALADREGDAAKVTAQAKGCTDFQGVSAVAMDVVVGKNPVEVGDKTTYTITITNPGTAPVTDLKVKAIIPQEVMLTNARAISTDPRYTREKLKDPTLGDKIAAGQLLLFDPIPALAPGKTFTITVDVTAKRAGDVRFKVEMTADQLKVGGPVTEEESTTIFAETDRPPDVRPQKRVRDSDGKR